jgi:hypothetical protein
LETSPLSGFPGDWRLFRGWSGECFAFMAKTLVISITDRGNIGIIRSPHLLFPGGVEVTEEPWEHAEAVARTAALMADAGLPSIFEAAFQYEGIHVRGDVLERLSPIFRVADGASNPRSRANSVLPSSDRLSSEITANEAKFVMAWSNRPSASSESPTN